MSPQGVMSSEKVSNSPALSPIKGQKPSLGAQTRSQDFSSLSLGVIKTLPSYPMLVNQSTSNPSLYILSRDSQGQLRSKKLYNRATSCELVADLITSYSSMPRDPVQPHRMVEISFNVLWHCWTNGDVLMAWIAFKAA